MHEDAFRKGFQTLRHSYEIVPGQPVEVGRQPQLLMDWHVVDDLNGTHRTVHLPVKHADNPILCAPDGRNLYGGTVLRDERTGLFRMWLSSVDEERTAAMGKLARPAR